MPFNLNITLPDNVPPEAAIAISVVLGIILLLFGRPLYWAFVAIAGFFVGMALANHWLADQQPWIRILVAVAAGIVGAVLGIFVQRLAFAIGGFFAGGYLALAVTQQMNIAGDPQIWMVVGGILGAIIAALIMDWAIIVLSSLVGAAAIVNPFQAKLDAQILPAAFLILAVIGIVFQGWWMTRRVVRPAVVTTPMRPVV